MSHDVSANLNQFEDLVTLFPALVRITDRERNATWCNDEWLKFRGRTLEQELGTGWISGVHPDDIRPLLSLFKRKFDLRLPFETKYRALNANGEFRWLLYRGAPRLADNGDFLGYCSTCVDIHDVVATDHDNAQFFDIAGDIFLTTRLDGTIGRFNPSIERVLGWTPNDLPALSYQKLIHPDDYPASLELRESLLRGDDVVNFENRFLHKDGMYRWLSWRCRHDLTTQVTYACAVDITDRKHYQQELEKALNRFDLAISATSEGVYEYDFDSETFYVSPRFKEQLGFGADDAPIDVDDWIAMVHPEDVQQTLDAHRRHLEGEIPDLNVTFRMRHKSGVWRAIKSRAVLLRHDDGRPCKIVGIHADITEQQTYERELQMLKEDAEAANRAKSDFLANMSHEIRTPMNVIFGAATILKRGLLSAEKQAKALDGMFTSAQSLMDLINDLLDFSKIEARMLTFDVKAFDANALAVEVTEALEIQAQAKGLSLQQQNRCACVGERLFLGDRARIKQVIINLVANAVKFTEKGTITVGVDCVHTGQDNIEELRFYVSDTGIGIPAEKLGAIFGKFEQADSSITRRFGGSGLGLTIAKSLAEAMGGTISAESEVDIGSTFILKLPLTRGDSLPGQRPESSSRPLRRRPHVLLVEDNAGNVLVATHFLDDAGYTCDVANDGLEAVNLVKSNKTYDAILMDVQMPVMDGRRATAAIRSFENAEGRSPVPIIAVTAHAMSHDRQACIEAGMDDYISKPFDMTVLNRILRSLITSGARTSSEL